MNFAKQRIKKAEERFDQFTLDKTQKISERTLRLVSKRKYGDKVLLGMDVLQELDRPNFRNFIFLFFKKIFDKRVGERLKKKD